MFAAYRLAKSSLAFHEGWDWCFLIILVMDTLSWLNLYTYLLRVWVVKVFYHPLVASVMFYIQIVEFGRPLKIHLKIWCSIVRVLWGLIQTFYSCKLLVDIVTLSFCTLFLCVGQCGHQDLQYHCTFSSLGKWLLRHFHHADLLNQRGTDSYEGHFFSS